MAGQERISSGAAGDQASGGNGFNALVASGMVFAAIFGQRLVLPVGRYEVSFVLVSLYALLGILFMTRGIHISVSRAVLWTVSIAAMCVSVLLSYGEPGVSLRSFLLLLALYSPLCLCSAPRPVLDRILDTFASLMSVLALVGIGQVLGQLVGIPKYDPVALLPEQFLGKAFHNHIKIAYDLDYFKADGIVFAEPSFFSQFLGFAILLRIDRINSGAGSKTAEWVWLVIHMLALVLTFSGTGLIALAFGLLWTIHRWKLSHLMLMGAVGTLFVAVVLLSPWGHFLTSRVEEFTTRDSSASRRFISPFRLAAEAAVEDGGQFLIGHGPGTIDNIDHRDETAVAHRESASLVVEDDAFRQFYEEINRNEALSPTFLKCIYEYGCFGVPFIVFLFACFLSGAAPLPLRMAMLASLFFLGGNLLVAPLVGACHILAMLQVTEDDAALR